MIPTSLLTSSDYTPLFRTFIERTTRQLITQAFTVEELQRPRTKTRLLHVIGIALQSPTTWNSARELLLGYHEQFTRLGYHSDWRAMLEQGIAQSKVVQDEEAHARLQLYVGELALEQGAYDVALTMLKASEAYFAGTTMPEWLARTFMASARLAYQRGHSAEAEGKIEQALAQLPPDATTERAYAYRLRGSIFYQKRNWDRALQAFEQAFALWQRGGDEAKIAAGWVNLGSVWREMGHIEKASDAYVEAIRLFTNTNHLMNGAIASMNLGNLHLGQHQYEQAVVCYENAEPIFRRSHALLHLARLANNQGMAYARLERWEQAEARYRESLRHWDILENGESKANVMDNLGLVLHAQDRYTESSTLYQEALQLLEGIGSTNRHLQTQLHHHLAESQASLKS